jgi:hypothetical protein
MHDEDDVIAYRRIRDELKRLETEKKRIADRIKARVEAGAELPGVKVTHTESVTCTNLTELCEWLAAMDATPADMLDMCKLDVRAFMKALDRDRKLSPGDMAEMREFFTMTTVERLNVR